MTEMKKISLQTGIGSSVRKKNIIVKLMRSFMGVEMKFLVRTQGISAAVVEAYNIVPSLNYYGVPSMVKRFHKCGDQRAQIHESLDVSIHIFSQNGHETTARYPDIAIIDEFCEPSATTFILDAEVEEEETDLANAAILIKINCFLQEALNLSCEEIMVKFRP
ncbi:hypothetical protein SAY86_005050 [Trapa natans]|uniref:Uncharacterized protein n=1 Tax=Trapa natans TaxID=22666 RepID=A0AAN7L8D8_TRANT|nr:hypothetical protein SAY86_005050 [Trapa natans]